MEEEGRGGRGEEGSRREGAREGRVREGGRRRHTVVIQSVAHHRQTTIQHCCHSHL